MNLRNITIKNKLIAGFGILAVLVVLVAGMSLRALSTATDGFASYVNGINARADVASQIRTAVVDRRADRRAQSRARDQARRSRTREDRSAARARRRAGAPEAVEGHDRGGQRYERGGQEPRGRIEALYGPVATNIVSLALAGKHDQAIVKMDDECRPLLAQLVKATDDYATYTASRREEIVHDYRTQYETQRRMLIALCSFAVLA